jgi:uncharacterized protein (UPF0332 family)
LSPRSKEFYERARERLEARAALSERDMHAKTHRGTWNMLRQALVADGSLPAELVAEAERMAELREGADYDALVVEGEQAERAIDSADRFLSSLDDLLDE